MATQKEELQIIIDAVDKASKDLKNISKGLDQVEDSAEDAGKSTKGFGDLLAGPVGLAVGAFATGALLNMGQEMLNLGIESQQAERALIAYAGSATSAEVVTRKIQDAVGGTVTKLEAMRAGSSLLAMGLAETADEAAELADIAVTLGASMGTDAQTSMENFNLMLANRSIPRMDTYGLSSEKAKKRMDELAKSGMSLERAFKLAVLEQGREKLVQLEEAGFTAGTSVERLGVIWGDLKVSVATAMADVIVPAIDTFADISGAQDDALDRIILLSDGWWDFNKRVERANISLGYFTPAMFEARQSILKANQAVDEGRAFDGWSRAVNASVEAAEGLATATEGVAEGLGRARFQIQELTTEALGSQAVNEIASQMQSAEEHEIPLFEEALRGAMTELLNIPQHKQEVFLALQELRTRFQNDLIGPQAYLDVMIRLNDEINNFATNRYLVAEGIRYPDSPPSSPAIEVGGGVDYAGQEVP